LDISGAAGFFGGDEAVQAMFTIHLSIQGQEKDWVV